VVIANHITYVDWLFIAAVCKRPLRFVMDSSYHNIPIANTSFATPR